MNTYALVVQWSTVSLILVLTCIMGLNTRAKNSSNAFAQDKLKQQV